MARLTRLAVAGQAHLMVLRGLDTQALCIDDDDRRRFLAALRDAAVMQHVAVHAYALQDDLAMLLVSPEDADGLGRLVQELGRRHVAGFNRRHGRSGPMWRGRFRAAIVQPGATTMDAMVYVDTLPVRTGLATVAADYLWSSARGHLGMVRDPVLTPGAAYWQLGNTPFDRELAYRQRLEDALSPDRTAELTQACTKGWAVGDSAFLAQLAVDAGRPVQPRPRGRPPKTVDVS